MQIAETNGYKITIEGTWCEISNKYGVLESGDVAMKEEEIPEEYASYKLGVFIGTHHVMAMGTTGACIKRVAYDEATKEYVQLQAIIPGWTDTWVVQRFDNELLYMGEDVTNYKYADEVLAWMKKNYKIESCLMAEVYRDSFGDCTNDGISSFSRALYILDDQKGPFEPYDIRQCVYIEKREIMGSEYVDCKPVFCRNRWYMAGGNFLYTSDSRFKEITGVSYPISIHDRYEG